MVPADEIDEFVRVIEQFQEISPTISIQQICFFLQIAAAEGRSISEVAFDADIPLTTASRYLRELSTGKRGTATGLIRSFRSAVVVPT